MCKPRNLDLPRMYSSALFNARMTRILQVPPFPHSTLFFKAGIFQFLPSLYWFLTFDYRSICSSFSPFFSAHKFSEMCSQSSVASVSLESPDTLDVIGPGGFINIDTQCLDGTTFHFHANDIYRYKGYPRCFSRYAHSSGDRCMENYKAVHSHTQSEYFFNLWIHYPSDGSDAWVQKDFVSLLSPHEFRHVRNAPSFVIYLPRSYATRVESYIFHAFNKVVSTPVSDIQEALPRLSRRATLLWYGIIENSFLRVSPIPKVVLCPHQAPTPLVRNCVTWGQNVLYRQSNQCPKFPYLMMSRYENYSVTATEEPARCILEHLDESLPHSSQAPQWSIVV